MNIEDILGKFEGRPNHPDFWTLSQLVLGMDASAKDGPIDVREMIEEVVDFDSISYMANGRAALSVNLVRDISRSTGVSPAKLFENIIPSLYVDAFILGARFAEERARRAKGEQPKDDSPEN